MSLLDKAVVFATYKARFGDADDAGMYSNLDTNATSIEQGFFSIGQTVAIYASAIAILLTFAFMVWYSGRSDKRVEAKERVKKNAIVVILIFSVPGLIALVQGIAI